MITVFHAPRTRSLRVLWMLEEMGLPYQVRPVISLGIMQTKSSCASTRSDPFQH
jgi:hypothetical protein